MRQYNKQLLFSIYISTLLFLLSSCQVSKYIPDGQYLLNENDITFETKDPVANRNVVTNELKQLYQQEASSNFSAGWYFYWHKSRKDTTSLTRFFMSRAKEPSFFSEPLTVISAINMKNYMIQRGYFDVETDYDFKLKGKKAYVTYEIYPGQRYLVNTISFTSRDTSILKILQSTVQESHLRPGRPVDQRLYELEVNRITNLMQNRGYANFFSNFIEPLRGDSSENKVDVTLEVLPQIGGIPHTKYNVGTVRLITSYNPEIPLSDMVAEEYEGIQFLTQDGEYAIKKKALYGNVFLKSGEIYSRYNYNKTLRRLGRLAAIRFVNIRPVQDSDDPEILNYNIFITPGPKIELNANVDINNSNLSTFNQRFLGFATRLGLRNRNLFGGAENNSFNISTGLEFIPRSISPTGNLNYYFRFQDDLLLPKFGDFPGTFKLLSRIKKDNFHLLNPDFYSLLQEDAFTRLSVNTDFVIQPLFYDYTSLNFTYGFDLTIQNRKKWIINQTGVNYFIPRFTDSFIQNILNENPFLERSLIKQLFTGIFLRDITFNYTSQTNRANETYSFLSNFEVSGLEVAAIGLMRGRPITTIIEDGAEFAKYIRLDIDGRYNKIYSERHSAAFRLNIGLAVPYEATDEIPFVKQFFVGGGLSLRAWELREIGPGSYRDPNLQERGVQDRFQTGDFKFEINAEYRIKMFWLLEGATFLDIGNVWILKEDINRPGANLTARNFFKDLAVGSGLGLRLNIDFFIVRFDLGIKVKNPFPDLNTGSYWAMGNFRQMTNPNLAINYSF
jgi:outer membrane protein insertion porin family